MFKDELLARGNVSFQTIRSIAKSHVDALPIEQKNKIYDSLERGTAILSEEEQLDGYLFSFGNMHQAKLYSAFECLPQDLYGADIEIFDWGCGQAMATICYLDYLKSHNLNQHIRRITLIEPSKVAIERAQQLLSCYNLSAEIRCLTTGFDELQPDMIAGDRGPKLHFFSNILDVAHFDLPRFIRTFQEAQPARNTFVCVGPYYSNSVRMDEFMAAIAPDYVYGIADDPQWQRSWTRQMRVFGVSFNNIESLDDIRKRIDESKRFRQFHAGYILEPVDRVIRKSEHAKDAESLLHSLSIFNVHSNKPLDPVEHPDSTWSVINNLITRGIPTYPSLKLEEFFATKYKIATVPSADAPSISFRPTAALSSNEIFSALHTIDPRFKLEHYNSSILESTFEKAFVKHVATGSTPYLMQLLEPQRRLSSMVTLPNKHFSSDQRVDFAIEMPYSKGNDMAAPIGFIVEVDGKQYHSGYFEKERDTYRDRLTSGSNWRSYRLQQIDKNIVNQLVSDASITPYLEHIASNFNKSLSGKWLQTIECVLAPIAIARVQKVLVEAILSGHLSTSADTWNITVIERDLPCAAMAIDCLKDLYENLCKLQGADYHWPSINLTIVSTPEFASSPLHLGHKVVLTSYNGQEQDLCIDVSVLLRDKVDKMSITERANTYYIVRSSHFVDSARLLYTTDTIHYPEFVSKDRAGAYVTDEKKATHLEFFLQNIFRKRHFRQGQMPIISRALARKTTIGLLPTGGGKSLTYQIASVLQPGVTIVIDPLLSLMDDQYRGLINLRIDFADCINSVKNGREKATIANRMATGELLFVFMSPERFMIQGFRSSLVKMVRENHVYFANGIIDEVHCVSEWGHDFRSAYLHLGRNMAEFMGTRSGEVVTLMGLTATASFDVLADVERELVVPGKMVLDSDVIVRPEEDSRPELTYRVIQVNTNYSSLVDEKENYVLKRETSDKSLKKCSAESKVSAIAEILSDTPDSLASLNSRKEDENAPYSTAIPHFYPDQFYSANEDGLYDNAGILFCPHAKGTLGVRRNYENANSDTPISERIQNISDGRICQTTFVGGDKAEDGMLDFMTNRRNLMIATKAFGMGIDKPNVRYTIDLTHPASVESFVQESGRGGRDRKNAIGYLLYDTTEYLQLSKAFLTENYSVLNPRFPWLWGYLDRYILREDIKNFAFAHQCTPEDAQFLENYFIGQYKNVDKDVQLFFHSNSFRGADKEKRIMLEFTDQLLNVKPTNLLGLQAQLREAMGDDDLTLALYKGWTGLKIVSSANHQLQYAYFNLSNLQPRLTNTPALDLMHCQRIVDVFKPMLEEASNQFWEVRKEKEKNYKGKEFVYTIDEWLNTPLAEVKVDDEGIYRCLDAVAPDTDVFINISWENQLKQDETKYEKDIREIIDKIHSDVISSGQFTKAQIGLSVLDAEIRKSTDKKKVKLEVIDCDSYDELLSRIDKLTDGPIGWWKLYGHTRYCSKLMDLFNRRRDKVDTDKAIYRMCCIGLIDDVTIDYNSETYQIKVRKRAPGGYYEQLKLFLQKYYSPERVEGMVADITNHAGRNEIDKCLGFLTDFIYSNTEKKRLRSIDDVRLMCTLGIEEGDDYLKDWVHLYFNSKYARSNYTVYNEQTQKDDAYSLLTDTDKDHGNRATFDIVEKYINVLPNDHSGTEIENAKHLYGASMLILRSSPDNAALNLIKAFCLVMQGFRANETIIQEVSDSYYNGLYHTLLNEPNDRLSIKDFGEIVKKYNAMLKRVVKSDDKKRLNQIITDAEQKIMLAVHSEWLSGFANKYTR